MGFNSSLAYSESFLIGESEEDLAHYEKAKPIRRHLSLIDKREVRYYESITGVLHKRTPSGDQAALSDLKKAQMELQTVRDELRKMREERDKWKSMSHTALTECYDSIKRNGLQSDLSFQTLLYLDSAAAAARLDTHDRHMEDHFANDRCDLAAITQDIVIEIHYVKTNVEGDTLRWRLHSALNLVQYISKALQKLVPPTQPPADDDPLTSHPIYDDRLKSTLKSADVQLFTLLNEIRERGLDDYLQEFREQFSPEYDIVHHEYGLSFYEKSKASMMHMYSQPTRLTKIFEDENWDNNWI